VRQLPYGRNLGFLDRTCNDPSARAQGRPVLVYILVKVNSLLASRDAFTMCLLVMFTNTGVCPHRHHVTISHHGLTTVSFTFHLFCYQVGGPRLVVRPDVHDAQHINDMRPPLPASDSRSSCLPLRQKTFAVSTAKNSFS
jgi:hypothetical protein